LPEVLLTITGFSTLQATLISPNPSPSLATLSLQIANVKSTYETSLSGAKGKKGLMYTELKTLEISLKLLAAYVEATANMDAVNAANMILSTGMQLKKPSLRKPKIFSVHAGGIEGDAILNSKAVTRGAYIYQMSSDPQGISGWNDVCKSLQVKCVVQGLVPGQLYFFRVAVIDKNGVGAWSHSLRFIAT
jgi:hypothetical protein